MFVRTAAATLSLAVLLTGTAQPAQAIDPVTTAQVITAAVKAYEAWKSNQSTGKVLDAINEAKTAIIAHADALAAADAKACTRHAVVEAADAAHFSPDVLTIWAQQVTGCVTLIDSLLNAVADKNAISELGFALGTVGPIALATRKQAGLSTAGVLAILIGSHTTVKTKAAPACYNSTHVYIHRVAGDFVWTAQYHWGCTGADGTAVANDVYKNLDFSPSTDEEAFRWAAEHAPPIDIPAIEAKVGQNTSWKLAQMVLPVLQAA
jgi:hypothetical protein